MLFGEWQGLTGEQRFFPICSSIGNQIVALSAAGGSRTSGINILPVPVDGAEQER
jgi:hypothetical protein